MALRLFDWVVDMGPSATKTFNVRRAQFGDGYKQLTTLGINNAAKSWAGTKTGDIYSVLMPMALFLDEHEGAVPFLWVDPLGETKQYTCAGYTLTQRKANMWQISLQFEQFHGA